MYFIQLHASCIRKMKHLLMKMMLLLAREIIPLRKQLFPFSMCLVQ